MTPNPASRRNAHQIHIERISHAKRCGRGRPWAAGICHTNAKQGNKTANRKKWMGGVCQAQREISVK